MSQQSPLTDLLVGISAREAREAKEHLYGTPEWQRCQWFLGYNPNYTTCQESFALIRKDGEWSLRPFCQLCKKLTLFLEEEKDGNEYVRETRE